MRKQFTYLTLALALSTALVGCGSKTDNTPAPVETPVVTEAPEVTETPAATETPEVTETPAATDAPEATTEPTTAPTEKPAETAKPTAKPAATQKPTEKPVATQKPAATTKPTTKPTEAPKPVETQKPVETEKPAVSTLSASEVFDKTIAGIELPMNMEMDGTMLTDLYGIDTSLLKSYKVVAPVMSAHITEIAIFEVKDASNIEQIKAGIEKRTGGMNPQFMYPSLAETYENRKTVVSGNYVFFAMDSSVDALVANFQSAVK